MSLRTPGVSGFAPAQLAFSFVPEEDRQKMTAIWETHFSRTHDLRQRQIEAGRKRVALKVIDSKTLDIDWEKHRDLLERPLIAHEASELDVQAAEEEVEVASEITSSEDVDVPPELTEQAVYAYHEKVLSYSLGLLKTRGNAEEKYEILRWIWAPDISCWVTRNVDGVINRRPIYQRQLPFTFAMCCACSGLDAERLREGLAHVLRPVLKQLGMESFIK